CVAMPLHRHLSFLLRITNERSRFAAPRALFLHAWNGRRDLGRILRSSSRAWSEARHVPHLAARARLALAIEMQAQVALGGERRPVIDVIADEIAHLGIAVPHGRTERPSGNGPDMVPELANCAGVHGPVAGVVYARRDLVDEQRCLGVRTKIEHLDTEHTDVVECGRDAARDGA